MKSIFLPLIIFFFFSNLLFSQEKIGKIKHGDWNQTNNQWDLIIEEVFDYDEEDREVFRSHTDFRISSFLPHNEMETFSTYNQAREYRRKLGVEF